VYNLREVDVMITALETQTEDVVRERVLATIRQSKLRPTELLDELASDISAPVVKTIVLDLLRSGQIVMLDDLRLEAR
jgi:hypothetical protein